MATRAKKTKAKEAEEVWPLSPEAADAALPEVRELTAEEWHDLVDATARQHLHMGADEFIQRWKAGEWPNPDGTPVMNVLMLLTVGDEKII